MEEAIEIQVTTSNENVILVDDEVFQNNVDSLFDNFMPTTNVEELAIKIDEKIKYGFQFSCCIFLINIRSALARNKYDFTKKMIYKS